MKVGYDGQLAPITEQVRDIEGEGKRVITRERRYDTVGWLEKHRHISAHQLYAARRLQEDAESAEIMPQPNSGVGGAPRLGVLSDAQLAAMSAHADARRAVRIAFDKLGPAGERLIQLVVIENKTLGKAAAEMREPERGIMFALRIALDALARHYGLG
jgi:DNA-directed RNA polymerase specialized sigma24 family protein